MKVEMTIETGAVTTIVSREFDVDTLTIESVGGPVGFIETPALADVTQAVAAAAVTAHRITPKE